MHHGNQDGFSLVELVLTVLILAVIAAVSLPKFFNQATFDERFFSDDLLSATQYAGKLAVASGCSVRLTVASSGFFLEQDANCDYNAPNFSLAVQRPDDNSVFSNGDVPESISISTSHAVIIFLPNHRLVTPGGGTISTATIQLGGEVTRFITLYGASGYAVRS